MNSRTDKDLYMEITKIEEGREREKESRNKGNRTIKNE